MLPKITLLPEKKAIGLNFMSRKAEIQNATGTDYYSIQLYDPHYFDSFTPERIFEKWAAVAVSDFNTLLS